MENNHVTRLEIDLNALRYNLNYLKSKLESDTKVMAVVKAFGYGLGDKAISKYIEDQVAYFAVAYLDEGLVLRSNGIQKPILVLHPQLVNLNKIFENKLEPNIYNLALLKSVINSAQQHPEKQYNIHLTFNTGLNRLGFKATEIPEIVSLIGSCTNISVLSSFSHCAASEDLNEEAFTKDQITQYKEWAGKLSNLLGYKPLQHMLNTSGVLNYAETGQFDMVRTGIGMYGFGNDKNHTSALKNVLRLRTVISQIHTVNKGESIGYNRGHKASETLKVATLPIGHADGVFRSFGQGKGFVYINNQKAPVLGNVCMDMLMVNCTNITCAAGDEVVVYRDQEHIETLSRAIETIPYELLTAISNRVKRVYTTD